MTRGLLFLVILTSCRSTIPPTESLSTVDNELFCNGTKNMIVYIKQSQEIKMHYGDNLHTKGQVGLKIDNEVFKGLPFGYVNEIGLDSTDTLTQQKLNYKCYNQSDNAPDFDVSFSFYPKKKILSAIVMTILDKPGYRTGYQFMTKLEEGGQLGQVRISTIQE